jgi:endonuclease YncB( thermonuclease family)
MESSEAVRSEGGGIASGLDRVSTRRLPGMMARMMRLNIPALLLALLVSPAAAAGEYPARIVGVSDGDTLTVRVLPAGV